MKTDIFGKTSVIGDTIVFTAPRYKSLEHGKIVGFSKAGCPILKDEHLNNRYDAMHFEFLKKGSYTVKTDFVIV